MPKFIGEILQNGGDFALLDSSNIRGGFMQVDTLSQRDSLYTDKVKVGMLVYVDENQKLYIRRSKGWEEFKIGTNISDGPLIYTQTDLVTDIVKRGERTFIKTANSKLVVGDILGYDINTSLEGKYFTVLSQTDQLFEVSSADIEANQTVSIVGSTLDPYKQLVPVFHLYNGTCVFSQFLNNNLAALFTRVTVRLGLSQDKRWKLYAEDAYIKGTFIDRYSRNLSDIITENSLNIASIQSSLMRENLLRNPNFLQGTSYWYYPVTVKAFSVGGKLITTQGKFLGVNKGNKVYVFKEEGYPVLRIEDSYIQQPNKFLKSDTIELDIEYPCYITLSFDYKAITEGTLQITMDNDLQDTIKATQDLSSYSEYHVFKTSFLWNGTGDLKIQYTGTINIKALSVRIDSIRSFEYKYQELFDYSDTLVEMAKEYLKNR